MSGRIVHDDCPYGWDALMGDSGKWSDLLSAFEYFHVYAA